MKQQLIDLWKTSFGDSDEFIRLYFDHVYRDENTLTLCENGRVISALQLLPFEMSYCGTTVPMAYLCGVCTLPAERGKGRMKLLMQQALEVMHDRRYALTALIPASERLFDYYERFGYAKAFDYALETYRSPGAGSEPAPSCRIVSGREASPEALYAYYDRRQRERACAVLHTAGDWKTLLKDCWLSGGDVWMALQDEQPCGMAIALPTDEHTVYVKEILYEHPSLKHALVRFLSNHYHRQTVQVRISPAPSNARPYGMARILDTQRMTALYRSFYPAADTSFLKDLNLQTLTQTLLHYDRRQGWMNLMLD